MRVSFPDRRSHPAGQRWRLQMWDMSCDRATQLTRQVGARTGHEQSSLTRGGQHWGWKMPWTVHSWSPPLPSVYQRNLFKVQGGRRDFSVCSMLTSINHSRTHLETSLLPKNHWCTTADLWPPWSYSCDQSYKCLECITKLTSERTPAEGSQQWTAEYKHKPEFYCCIKFLIHNIPSSEK